MSLIPSALSASCTRCVPGATDRSTPQDTSGSCLLSTLCLWSPHFSGTWPQPLATRVLGSGLGGSVGGQPWRESATPGSAPGPTGRVMRTCCSSRGLGTSGGRYRECSQKGDSGSQKGPSPAICPRDSSSRSADFREGHLASLGRSRHFFQVIPSSFGVPGSPLK